MPELFDEEGMPGMMLFGSSHATGNVGFTVSGLAYARDVRHFGINDISRAYSRIESLRAIL